MNSLRLLATVLLLGGCSRTAEPVARPPLEGSSIGGPFALVDQHGRHVTDRSFAGRYRIMYFGYTFCPDVCPIDAAAIGTGLVRFEARHPEFRSRVVPLFVTVDPARDTPAILGQFVAAFHPRMVGLTGSEADIARVAKAYGVPFSREKSNGSGAYVVAHGQQTYLMDPNNKPLALLPADQGADAVAAELERWVR